jgi:hypothetical protein
MREIRDGNKVTGVDRIAVMAALNIANDLLRERRAPPTPVAPLQSAPPTLTARTRRRRIQSHDAGSHRPVDGGPGKIVLTVTARPVAARASRCLPIHVPCGVRVGQSLFEPMLS